MRKDRIPGALAVLAFAACADGRDGASPFGSDAGGATSPGSAAGETSASGPTNDGSGLADSAGVDGTGPKFDTPDGATGAGDGTSEGCEKIDFLFAIDNSCSMGAHQTRLINSFGPFLDTIFSTVEAQDYQILVVDSDADQDEHSGCAPSGCPGLIDWCGNYCAVQDLITPCDRTLGAGVVQPYNNEASNAICGVPGNHRFLTADLGQAQLKQLFPCMAQVGTFGSGAERPMSAVAEALGAKSQPGACNDGFVREDAVLVVTVISDDYPVPGTDDDASTVGSPQSWYDAVVDAKGGNAQNVVMLGIVNTPDATCVAGAGDPIVHPTDRFVEFVQNFGDRGIMGNICDNDYNAFFSQAVALIDSTCDEFVPEG